MPIDSWATVCKTVRPVLSDRCLSVCPVCLSVTLTYCGQTVGWITMPLGMMVGLGPGHTVLDGDPASTQRAPQPPIFGPCLLWPNRWMDQRHHFVRRYRTRPRQHCVSSPRGKGHSIPILFSPCLLRPNGRPSQQLPSSCTVCCDTCKKYNNTNIFERMFFVQFPCTTDTLILTTCLHIRHHRDVVLVGLRRLQARPFDILYY